jgi:hypothetical protein
MGRSKVRTKTEDAAFVFRPAVAACALEPDRNWENILKFYRRNRDAGTLAEAAEAARISVGRPLKTPADIKQGHRPRGRLC